MDTSTFDLADVVLVNESHDEAVPGDISIFRNEREACSYLEHWWVEDGEGYALTGAGVRLILGVDATQNVAVVSREASPRGRELVELWLKATATSVSHRRTNPKPIPHSVDALIDYIGFTQ